MGREVVSGLTAGKGGEGMVFFFNDTATTEIYTLSLHDALPILDVLVSEDAHRALARALLAQGYMIPQQRRSEEHTSELQSQSNIVCRLLLEKKKEHRGFSLHPHDLATEPGLDDLCLAHLARQPS